MNKTLLNQALKFKENIPTFSQTTYLNKLVKQYQKENDLYFIELKLRQKSKVLDWEKFFLFLSEVGNDGKCISSFE
jgi:hypothetical protein